MFPEKLQKCHEDPKKELTTWAKWAKREHVVNNSKTLNNSNNNWTNVAPAIYNLRHSFQNIRPKNFQK